LLRRLVDDDVLPGLAAGLDDLAPEDGWDEGGARLHPAGKEGRDDVVRDARDLQAHRQVDQAVVDARGARHRRRVLAAGDDLQVVEG
jgi:hypothetical protein